MSTNHLICFSSALAPRYAAMEPDDALRAAEAAFARFPHRIETSGSSSPRFGGGFEDDDRFDDLAGIAVVDGRLLVGLECDNLEWPDAETLGGGGVDFDGGGPTRIEVLLRWLASATAGPPGEVVGSLSDEYAADFGEAGAPLVRCADGAIRCCDVGWRIPPSGEGPPSPSAVPPDAIGDAEGIRASVDVRRLWERLALRG